NRVCYDHAVMIHVNSWTKVTVSFRTSKGGSNSIGHFLRTVVVFHDCRRNKIQVPIRIFEYSIELLHHFFGTRLISELKDVLLIDVYKYPLLFQPVERKLYFWPSTSLTSAASLSNTTP
ncbi:hypothetical protein C7459_1051, partial [Tumebacillus permanentifrigoris]